VIGPDGRAVEVIDEFLGWLTRRTTTPRNPPSSPRPIRRDVDPRARRLTPSDQPASGPRTGPRPLRASGSHRSPDTLAHRHASREPPPTPMASDHQPKRSGLNARRTPARPGPGATFIAAFDVPVHNYSPGLIASVTAGAELASSPARRHCSFPSYLVNASTKPG